MLLLRLHTLLFSVFIVVIAPGIPNDTEPINRVARYLDSRVDEMLTYLCAFCVLSRPFWELLAGTLNGHVSGDSKKASAFFAVWGPLVRLIFFQVRIHELTSEPGSRSCTRAHFA
jgi:hypothetical protein